jgi:hypothetical protein
VATPSARPPPDPTPIPSTPAQPSETVAPASPGQPAGPNRVNSTTKEAAPLALEALGTGAFIDNGTIQLGVNPEGELNVVDGPPSSTGYTTVGLRYLPNNTEAISPGCECEGWGAADLTSGVSGYANVTEGGAFGMSLVAFDAFPGTAVSTVDIGSTLRVTHDYHAALNTPNLFEVTVEVVNISASSVDLRYRRVMDWDVEPTPFDEFARAAASTQVVSWSLEGTRTTGHLARVDGKYLFVQFFAEGPRAGELATAFVPNQGQLGNILAALGK